MERHSFSSLAFSLQLVKTFRLTLFFPCDLQFKPIDFITLFFNRTISSPHFLTLTVLVTPCTCSIVHYCGPVFLDSSFFSFECTLLLSKIIFIAPKVCFLPFACSHFYNMHGNEVNMSDWDQM